MCARLSQLDYELPVESCGELLESRGDKEDAASGADLCHSGCKDRGQRPHCVLPSRSTYAHLHANHHVHPHRYANGNSDQDSAPPANQHAAATAAYRDGHLATNVHAHVTPDKDQDPAALNPLPDGGSASRPRVAFDRERSKDGRGQKWIVYLGIVQACP